LTDRSAITDEEFNQRLMGSKPSVRAVALHLRLLGYEVTHNDPVKAVTYAEKGHEDVDIVAIWPPEGIERPIEVKGLRQNFTCRDDWRRDNGSRMYRIIVDEVEKFHEKQARGATPWRYYLVSSNLTHAFVVDVEKTVELWVHQPLDDCTYKEKIPYYRVPIEDIQLVELRKF